MILLYFIIGYVALYLAIWLHEVGHGLMYAKYGCKDNPFKVHVPLYLFFSTPHPIDEDKAKKTLSHRQIYHVGIAGIIASLLFGIPVFLFLFSLEFPNTLAFFFLFSFALFHLVEASTYLVLSNIFLSSDMVLVQQYNPRLRIPLFIIGLFIIGIIVFMVINCPASWRFGLVLAIFIMTACTVIGRIIFTKIHTSKVS